MVDSLIPTPNNNIAYVIGDVGGAQSTAYSFEEDPQCNYTQTITILGELPFFQHKVDEKSFEVYETEDFALEGVYTVTVRSEIEFWSDYSKSSTIVVSEEFDFTINMINPCRTTVLTPMTINDMAQ